MESSKHLYSKVVILFCSLLLSVMDVEGLGYGYATSKCSGMKNDFDYEMMCSIAGTNNKFHISSLVPHEHDFRFVRIKNSTNQFLKCLTCNIYYCYNCGKMVHSKTDSISHQHCS